MLCQKHESLSSDQCSIGLTVISLKCKSSNTGIAWNKLTMFHGWEGCCSKIVNYSIGNNLGGLFHLTIYKENTSIRRKSVFDLDIFSSTDKYEYYVTLYLFYFFTWPIIDSCNTCRRRWLWNSYKMLALPLWNRFFL